MFCPRAEHRQTMFCPRPQDVLPASLTSSAPSQTYSAHGPYMLFPRANFVVGCMQLYSSLCWLVRYHFTFLRLSGITAPDQSHATVQPCIRPCFACRPIFWPTGRVWLAPELNMLCPQAEHWQIMFCARAGQYLPMSQSKSAHGQKNWSMGRKIGSWADFWSICPRALAACQTTPVLGHMLLWYEFQIWPRSAHVNFLKKFLVYTLNYG